MAKNWAQHFRRMKIGALFGLISGVCVAATDNGNHFNWVTGGIIVYSVLGGATTGLVLGSKFNPTVSVYWPWLVVIFGIGLVPSFGMMMAGYYQTPFGLRDDALLKYSPVLICALIATAVAMIAAITRHAKRLNRGENDDASNFSLATIMLVLGGASLAFGLLRWIGAPAVFFYIIVIFILGRFACLFVNAELTKRKKSSYPPAASPENEHSEKVFPENTPE